MKDVEWAPIRADVLARRRAQRHLVLWPLQRPRPPALLHDVWRGVQARASLSAEERGSVNGVCCECGAKLQPWRTLCTPCRDRLEEE